MTTPKERILLVENDPEVSDLISRQTLQPLGFRVEVVGGAAPAIQEAVKFVPDVIIADLNLPGLSGKDLLVALSSQGLEIPVIVIALKGMEGDVIQAFRLGAADYLTWPVREAEVVSAVERVLRQVRARREREMLARQLKQTNQELQRRVRELTTIFAIGKAVTSITDQHALMDKIVEGAIYVTEADSGWLLLREERSKTYILSACRNVPQSVADRLNQPWEDGISSLVALSGEPLSIHGAPIKRFKVARLGQSVLVVPVKAKREVVGLLVVIRQAPVPFGNSNQTLLEAVADYASISLVNARLFMVLEDRARSLQYTADLAQVSVRIKDEILQNVSQELNARLKSTQENVSSLLADDGKNFNKEQCQSLQAVQDSLRYMVDIIESSIALRPMESTTSRSIVDLNGLARQAITLFQRVTQHAGVTLFAELPSAPTLVNVIPSHILIVFECILSNAIKYSEQGGQITVRIEKTSEGGVDAVHTIIKDTGKGMDREQLAHIFDRVRSGDKLAGLHLTSAGITLPLVREIIIAHGGKIWVESKPDKGSTFHFSLYASSQ